MSTETQTYRVDGMSCEHCRSAVAGEVSKVTGVRAVDVDLKTKLVRVTGDRVVQDAVLAAIDEAGYDAARAA
jgi:copper chaperone CopZ